MKCMITFLVMASLLIFNASQSLSAWLIYHKPEFRGRIVDAETKEPIEGVVVVVVYSKYTASITGRDTSVIKVKETLTDKNGEFYFPSYTTIIGPLSGEYYASFIFYKPGYGSGPVAPRGLSAPSEEIFFSKGIGGTGELEGLVNGKIAMIKVAFGIVELPELKTREERLKAMPSTPTDIGSKELPLLYKAINEERRRLGLEGEEK